MMAGQRVREYLWNQNKMAEGGEETSNWWGGWIKTAKDKSVSAYEFVKQDITDFAGTMGQDVSEVAESVKGRFSCAEYIPSIHIPENLWTLSASQQETAAAATSKVRAGISSLIGGITKALVIPPDEDDDRAVPVTMYDMAKARLAAVQLDPGTYVNEPDGPAEQYEEWLLAFVLDEKKGDISELLVSNAEVRSLYTQLVPNSVSHTDFWHRYFYKVYQLEQDRARKEALKKRAEETQNDLTWEDEDEWGDMDVPASPPKSSARAAEQIAAGIKAEKEAAERLQETTSAKMDQSQESQTTEKSDTDKYNVENLPKPDLEKTADVNVPSNDSVIQSSTVDGNQIETTSQSISVEANTDVCDGGNNDKMDVKDCDKEIAQLSEPKVKVKGDLVVVGSDRTSPLSDISSQNTGNGHGKEYSSLDDDWEKDFDIEVTEEDMRLAQEAAKKKASGEADDEDDDWENWE